MTTPIPRPTSRLDVLAPIGRGGMAEVYLVALQAPAGVTKLAVLKRIWPELADDKDFVAMFLDEAKLAVRMSHPNVVQTYEVFSHGEELALSMEYLEGQPLTRAVTRVYRELSLAQRLRIVCDVLTGLDYAHNLCDYDGTPLGVVHRDVGPQNVFVTYAGHVKVMDFGVAKSLEGSHQTRPGGMKGRLAYMAPEQLRGEDVDRRADLYAVGVMLWELLAGRRMWQGRTEAEIARALREGIEPFPLPPEAGLPAAFDAVCRQALAPRWEDRFANAAEMEREVARLVPAVAESHARNLSRILSLAFAGERAERQALIDAHLRKLAGATPPPMPVVAPAAPRETMRPSEAPPRKVGRAARVGLGVAAAAAIATGALFVGRGWGESLPFSAGATVSAAPAPVKEVRVAAVAERPAVAASPRAPAPAPAPSVVEAPAEEPAPHADVEPEEPAAARAPVAARDLSRRDDRPSAHRKRHAPNARRIAAADDELLLPSSRPPRTLAKPLDTEDPYAP